MTVPLARRDPEAFPLFAQDDSTWCQLHFNRVTLQLSEEAVEHYANRDQAIDAMTVLASHWVEEVIDLITHYYPFDSEPSASVWQHAMSTTAEKFRLQNAPANAELLAIWNANPERPKATSLYLHYFEECFTIF